jgi:hypothetical protein
MAKAFRFGWGSLNVGSWQSWYPRAHSSGPITPSRRTRAPKERIRSAAHENIERTEVVEGSSDRVFGLVFAGVFLLVALWPLMKFGAPRWWSLAICCAFASLALIRPALLALPNRLWTKLGLILGACVSFLALTVLFYAVFTPLGVFMRITGKASIRLAFDPAARSYWIMREPPGPPTKSLERQF